MVEPKEPKQRPEKEKDRTAELGQPDGLKEVAGQTVGPMEVGGGQTEEDTPEFARFRKMWEVLDNGKETGSFRFVLCSTLDEKQRGALGRFFKARGRDLHASTRRWDGAYNRAGLHTDNMLFYTKRRFLSWELPWERITGCFPYVIKRGETSDTESGVARTDGMYIARSLRGKGLSKIVMTEATLGLIGSMDELGIDTLRIGAGQPTSPDIANQRALEFFDKAFPDAVKFERKPDPSGKLVIVGGDVNLKRVEAKLIRSGLLEP